MLIAFSSSFSFSIFNLGKLIHSCDKIEYLNAIKLVLLVCCQILLLSVCSPFSDRVGLSFHNILSPLLPVMDVFSVDP